ncbi:biotin--[acetyl-CoA-carboxylase] ligase [Paralimibaculum aggregatum]|uniref:biotin--[biotin carboxyl-carrier protein] ligase n=1 Tax=Paralimibaculum aggregatum TaxID=3036245 RepID=A0ABQ6LT18_9RHOB|nr:biotin--[acetyl-CoA-carboxylase] ligase [Limibaculum sp. NKW23]GMG85218.1 biotin--[acetyl-CoA-carboxylase] ligase [Limibaculum sp. NKW23]
MTAEPLPRRLILDEVDSTNAEAARRAQAGEPGPLWITAARQNAGRGRHGRAWAMPPGNLAATLLLRPALAPAEAAQLSFVACLAVADLLGRLAPQARVSLKWPNDPLLNGRKAAGVLLESAGAAGGLDWLAIGIGVNLAAPPPPEALRPGAHPPTAVAAEGGRVATPDAALDILAPAFAAWQARHAAQGFAPIRAAWLARAEGLGRQIEARLPSGTRSGIYEDMDETGRLVLREASGLARISAAELYFPG